MKEEETKYGVLDMNGKTLIPVVYDYSKSVDFDRIVSLSLELLTRYSQDTISKIDKVLSNYYLSECETGISDFYSRLEKLIKGRLNNEN